MSKLPPDIQKVLLGLRSDSIDAARLDRLAARIDGAAASVFAERLSGRSSASWWDLPAMWAATLIPASLVVALASVLVLWRVAPPKPVMNVSDATVLRAAVPINNPDAVDQALNELVTPQPRTRR